MFLKVAILMVGAVVAIVATLLGNNRLSDLENKAAGLSHDELQMKTVELNETNDLALASHSHAYAVFLFYLIQATNVSPVPGKMLTTIALDDSDAIQRTLRASGVKENGQELKPVIDRLSSGNLAAFEDMEHRYASAGNAYGKHIRNSNVAIGDVDKQIRSLTAEAQKVRLQVSLVQILGIIIALFKDIIPARNT